jgi:parallel beta-helix repeat protein
MKTNRLFFALLISAFQFLSFSVFSQGSLTPPGAPAPTFKTLQQIEPRIEINATNTPGDANSVFRITARGSYYLSGNIAGQSGKNGIVVGASGFITIDLNGFTVSGVPGSVDGIHADTIFVNNVIVRNGYVTNFDASGIKLTGVNHLVEHVIAIGNGQDGIAVGEAGVIRACIARANTSRGIVASLGAIITECAVSQNGGDGIFASSGSALTNCTAFDNFGTYGILAIGGSTLINCTAFTNEVQYGISVGDRCTLTNCTASLNTGTGTDSWGISAGAQCAIAHCSASGNLNTNGTASSDTGGGIRAEAGSTVKDCTVSGNRGDGIQVSSDCSVVGNTCDSNGFIASGTADGAGIHATGADNRIEGNNVTDNDRGIDVDSGGSFIVKNSASGSTGGSANNYTVVAGNADAAIETPGTAFTSTNPWANFSY